MTKRTTLDKISRFFKFIYLKLFRINDSPQKIAAGFGIGVCLGVLPFTGPIAALTVAFAFRVNRASALLGSLLTNTWLSIPVFFLSLRAGAYIAGIGLKDLHSSWTLVLKNFHWSSLLDLGVYKVIVPIIAGYALVSLAIGAIAYILVLIIVKSTRSSV